MVRIRNRIMNVPSAQEFQNRMGPRHPAGIAGFKA